VEIHFPARIGKSYVTANSTSVKRATKQFLDVTGSKQSAPSKKVVRVGGGHKKKSPANLIDVSGGGRQQALDVAKDARLITIYYPTVGMPHSSFSVSSPRAYRIC